MKIIYVSAASIPSNTANSIQVMKMCQAMVQKGFEVELLTPPCQTEPEFSKLDLWHHYGVRNGFPIRRLPWPGFMGGHIYAIFAVIYSICSKAKMVYCRHLPSAAIASVIGLPVICELHDLPAGHTGALYLHLFIRGKGSHALVMISDALRNDLLKAYPHWMDESRIIVAADGVDIDRFARLPDTETARRELGLSTDGCMVGYAGHFYPGKGVELVLRLAAMCPGINFLLVGGEPDVIATLSKEFERTETRNVFLPGFVPNAELPLYLAACDVLLLPNQPKVSGSSGGDIGRYTSPMKLFEYLASGRAIISSDLPVLREVLDSRVAKLVPPNDERAWATALVQLCKDPELRTSLAQEAKRLASQYSWRRRVDLILGEHGLMNNENIRAQ